MSKEIEPELSVYIQIGGKFIPAGLLSVTGSGKGEFIASFKYLDSYLDRVSVGQAFALDPINLPPTKDIYTTTSRYHVLGALFDAAPDAWGRTVMALDEAVSPDSLQEKQILLKGNATGVGAIAFSKYPFKENLQFKDSLPHIDEIERVYESVKNIEKGVNIGDSMREVLTSSWDIGGARPKAILVDDNNDQWIVKFPKSSDSFNKERVEHASLAMARDIGINTPDNHLYEFANGASAILIKRFDRVEGQHLHYISAASLISPPADFDKRQMDTTYGASIFSYSRISDVTRLVSANVPADAIELYARMVLNVLINNTDDHLKNTGFLLNEDYKKYRLSPVFDVLTQEGQMKHMLHIGGKAGRVGSIENALCAINSFGIKEQAALNVIDLVKSVVANRNNYYKDAGLSKKDINKVNQYIHKDAGRAYRVTVKAPYNMF